jgi:hypothetical protein
MKIRNTLVLTLIGLGIIFVVAGVIYHYIPAPKKCSGIGPCVPGPGCTYMTEIQPDPSLPTPSSQPYLGGFATVYGAGPPFCGGVWYAYRYVTSVGGYSPLSQWTGYNPQNPTSPLPIYTGASSLPCPPQGCEAWNVPLGNNDCTGNSPIIVLLDPLPSLPSGTYINIHRQSGQAFSASSEGEIVGSMWVCATGTCVRGPVSVSAFFQDSENNPDPNSQTKSCC